MWTVSISFVLHRLLLFFVVLFAVNQNINVHSKSLGFFPTLLSFKTLKQEFLTKVESLPEYKSVQSLRGLGLGQRFDREKNLASLITSYLIDVLPLRGSVIFLLLSQLMVFWVLREIFTLLTRVASEENATTTTLFFLVWPSSYLWSFQIEFPFMAYLIVAATRFALDMSWVLAGLCVSALALFSGSYLLLIPYLLYLLVNFQRHFQMKIVIKKISFFLIPILGAIAFSRLWPWQVFSQFFNLSQFTKLNLLLEPQNFFSYATFTILTSALGMVFGFMNYYEMSHKLLPFHFFMIVYLCWPLRLLPEHMLMGAVCFEGICRLPIRMLQKILNLSLIVIGVYLCYGYVFSI